jgi:hypothetical protein
MARSVRIVFSAGMHDAALLQVNTQLLVFSSNRARNRRGRERIESVRIAG